jgi:ADP-ribose pyrophosphatase YjhB (NUDIX family)
MLSRRTNSPATFGLFPKGTKEHQYSLAATAAKDVYEETGLLVEIESQLIDVERSETVCRYFLAQRINGDPTDMGWETQAVCLVPIDLLRQLLPSEYDRPIVDMLVTLYGTKKKGAGLMPSGPEEGASRRYELGQSRTFQPFNPRIEKRTILDFADPQDAQAG